MTTFNMPGSFHAEGVNPGLFRPLQSPSNSGYLSGGGRSTSTPSYDTASKRKRRDFDSSKDSDRITAQGVFDIPPARNTPDGTRFPEIRYALAGQLNTPNGAGAQSEILGDSVYSESDYRRALGSKRTRDELGEGPTPLFDLPLHPTPTRGWGSAALGTIGGVVGKVWQFCATRAFKGFYAGGGSTFEMKPSGELEEIPVSGSDSVLMHEGQYVPGHFPNTGCAFEAMDEDAHEINSRASTPTAPAAKRRQTDQADDLGRNWVMVKEPRVSISTPQRRSMGHKPSPRNRNQAPSAATGRRISTTSTRLSTPLSTPRRSLAHPPYEPQSVQQPVFSTSKASYASPRSPSPTKQVTLQASTAPFQAGHSRRKSNIGVPSTPTLSHRRTHSNASAASSRASNINGHARASQQARPGLIHARSSSNVSRTTITGPSANNIIGDDRANASPRLDAEAKKLAAKRQREERKTDVKMDDFNQRLQDMIRQGQEALGTRIEVDSYEDWEDE